MKFPPKQRLDYVDGDFHWVFPDDIPLSKYRKVEHYLSECRAEVNDVLPSLELDAIPSLSYLYSFLDEALWRLYSPYAYAISGLIGIPRPEDIKSVSRYSFFVQRFDVNPEEGLICLSSRLELVLGEGCYETPEVKSDTKVPTSGDLIWDIETSIRLSFKHNAEGMINERCLISCLAMLEQASEQMKMAQEEAENSGKTSNSKPNIEKSKGMEVKFKGKQLDEDYAKDEAAIFEALGIELPEE
jgi:hypothetical protein